MEKVIQGINQEIERLEESVLSLKAARKLLVDGLPKPVATKSKTRSRTKSEAAKIRHRTKRLPIGALKDEIKSVLGQNGSMSARQIVAAMKSDGFKFIRGSNRLNTVRSSLGRMVIAKEIGRINTENGIVFTAHEEVLHPEKSTAVLS